VIGELPEVRVAHASIRDWTRGAPATTFISDLITDFTAAFAAEGLDLLNLAQSALSSAPARSVYIKQDVKVNLGNVVGADITFADPGTQAVETLVAALSARAARGLAATTLVLIIDALDEWEMFGIAALPALRDLASRHADFASWKLKVLLSGQYQPGWLSTPESVDLADVDAEIDLRQFAAVRLAGMPVPEADQKAMADQVVRLSDGLFLVASGYLDEIADGDLKATDLSCAPPTGGAVRYYVAAIERARRRFIEAGQSGQWRDAERFLAMLSVVPQGRSTADMADAWPDPDIPSTGPWSYVSRWVFDSPLRRYIASQPGDAHYRLVHPTMREALAALLPIEARIGVSAERRRWIQMRTPLSGRADPGTGWDPANGRVAMAEVGTILAEMLATARTGGNIDEAAHDEARAWAGRLLESWEWIEQSVLHADPHAAIPLGLPQGLYQIGLMTRADPDLAEMLLWTDPYPLPLSAPVLRPPQSAAVAPKQRFVARASDPLIQEILSKRAWFATKAAAEKRLGQIADRYVIARESKDFDQREQLILFIRAFALTLADRQAGVKGHHAQLLVTQANGGWTISAEEYEKNGGAPFVPTPKRPHVNFGDELLRRLRGNPKGDPKKVEIHDTRDDAQAELDRFKRRAGKVIDLPGKMYAMVYDRYGPIGPDSGRRLTITRIELVIVPAGEGYEIVIRIRGYQGGKGEYISHADYLAQQDEAE
jgi:hypothetical protein